MNAAPSKTAIQQKAWNSRWFNFVFWAVMFTFFIIFLRAVEPILLPFVLGMLVAYLMDPLATRLQRWGVDRSLATAIITFALIAVLVALVVWLAPILYQQFTTLITRAPVQLHALENSLHDKLAPLLTNLNKLTGGDGPDAIPADMSELVSRAFEGSGAVATRVFTSGAALLNVVALLLITPIVCFYLIRDWPSMVRKVDTLLPLAYAPTIREQLYLINRTLAGYLRGQITVMLIMSAFYVGGLALCGLNFALALGLLAGCIIIIPYIGSIISIGLGLFVAYGQFTVTPDFWEVVAVYGAGQILESQILTPKIIGDRVGLHPLWMLFGMLAGAVLLGLVGVLLAVPITAVIGVLVKFVVNRYLASSLYTS